jgi:hypothetical protein
MKQSVIEDFTKEVIIIATTKQAVMMALNKSSLYPQESFYQVAKQFDLEPIEVIKIYEDSKKEK